MNAEELKQKAMAIASLGHRFIAMENFDGSVDVCGFDNNDDFFPLATVDLLYHEKFDGQSMAVAAFYVSANPATILALIAERDELAAKLDRAQAEIRSLEKALLDKIDMQ